MKILDNFSYEKAHSARLIAETQSDWPQATYWLAQQMAAEHRDEIRAQHRLSVVLDVCLIIIAAIQLWCLFR